MKLATNSFKERSLTLAAGNGFAAAAEDSSLRPAHNDSRCACLEWGLSKFKLTLHVIIKRLAYKLSLIRILQSILTYYIIV
jgi:hypothetical protein|tara:strand:+ start:101 stop:343 length:243 start_codon:yes stop_codon:yes gene_type:complete